MLIARSKYGLTTSGRAKERFQNVERRKRRRMGRWSRWTECSWQNGWTGIALGVGCRFGRQAELQAIREISCKSKAGYESQSRESPTLDRRRFPCTPHLLVSFVISSSLILCATTIDIRQVSAISRKGAKVVIRKQEENELKSSTCRNGDTACCSKLSWATTFPSSTSARRRASSSFSIRGL